MALREETTVPNWNSYRLVWCVSCAVRLFHGSFLQYLLEFQLVYERRGQQFVCIDDETRQNRGHHGRQQVQ